MTMRETGYALLAGEAVEEWEFGGDILRLLVSADTVTVVEGLARGGGPPLHVHDDEDEVVAVLDGRLTFRVGDGEGTIGTGGLLWMPRRVPHTIANLDETPCRFLTFATPGGIERLFRAQSRYLASLPPGAAPDPAAMATLDGAASRRVVGPPLG
jgi:mannose-6-phosphate isomerase-like protein (cupin superfamily)